MSKIDKACVVCNSIFSVFPASSARRKTCSKECGYEIQRKDHRRLKACASCGEETFNPKFCSNKCQKKLTIKSCYERDVDLFSEGKLRSRSRIRPLLIKRDGLCCSNCKLVDWMNKPITLWVDHIDGNASNNDSTNLRLICPNCDSQNDTFGSKNKGNGRKSHGLKPWQ